MEDVSKVKVGLEATGHYSYNLLGYLIDKGLPTYAINSDVNHKKSPKKVLMLF